MSALGRQLPVMKSWNWPEAARRIRNPFDAKPNLHNSLVTMPMAFSPSTIERWRPWQNLNAKERKREQIYFQSTRNTQAVHTSGTQSEPGEARTGKRRGGTRQSGAGLGYSPSQPPETTKPPHFCGGFVLYGAGTRSRTRDLLITSQLLYQLSYTGVLGRRL